MYKKSMMSLMVLVVLIYRTSVVFMMRENRIKPLMCPFLLLLRDPNLCVLAWVDPSRRHMHFCMHDHNDIVCYPGRFIVSGSIRSIKMYGWG
jgi:hypothetical protein